MSSTMVLRPPELAAGFEQVGHSDQGGRPDAMQLQYWRSRVYVGHLFSGGFSVIDVTDPRQPQAVGYYPAPANTWNIHLQAADDLLLVMHAKDLWKEFDVEASYYSGSVGSRLAGVAVDWSAGVAIYDIADPANPRRISFLPVDGVGVHRLWYVGGRYAYASRGRHSAGMGRAAHAARPARHPTAFAGRLREVRYQAVRGPLRCSRHGWRRQEGRSSGCGGSPWAIRAARRGG
jgi:hypothetical protein